jgi:hypothetical protein
MFEILMNIIEELGEKIDIRELSEDFLGSAFSWNNYLFKLFIGQGSFWRIYKDGELIFQSA